MAKILITGGLGYVGYDLIKQLVSATDHELVIFDNLSKKNIGILLQKSLNNRNVKFVQGDILDNRKVNQIMEGIDSVIHLAAKVTTPFGQGDFQMFDYVNNWGTANVAQAALDNGVKEVIYLSSLSVYGHSDELMTLTSSIEPKSEYSKSKYNGERQLQILDGKCKVVVVRSGNTYGFNPSIRLDTVVNNFVFNARYNQLLLINGSGQENRGFIEVKRLASQIGALVLSNKYNESTYVLCDHTKKVIEIVEILQAIYCETQYRHVNAERKMVDQVFAKHVLPGFNILEDNIFDQAVSSFFNKFTVT